MSMKKLIKKALKSSYGFLPTRLKLVIKIFLNVYHSPYKAFPLGYGNNSPLNFPNCEQTFYFKPYQEHYDYESYKPVHTRKLKIEILPAKIIKNCKTIEVDNPSLLPVSFSGNGAVEISRNNDYTQLINGFVSDRFYFIKLLPGFKVKLNATQDNNVIVGDPIKLNMQIADKPKLVLCLFVDGLTDQFAPKDFPALLANTYKYFGKGVIFSNCYSNGEWSLPSNGNFFTGKYAHNHKMIHPKKDCVVGYNQKILSQYYQDKGYLTLQVGANQRKSPFYGYVKGFDRTIYKNDMDNYEAISILMEHLNAFPNRSNFCWIDLFDLHKTPYPNNVPDISCQANLMPESLLTSQGNRFSKSVYADFNHGQIERYKEYLKRLDRNLAILFNYIDASYAKDDVVVLLCSDHGQAFIDNVNHPLSDSRLKVPLMINSPNIKAEYSDEFVENIDILPTLLKLSNIDYNQNDFDGKVPASLGGKLPTRRFCYSESIFPGQTFKAIIRDESYKFYFESEYPVTDDCRISLGKISTKMEPHEHPELLQKYKSHVLSKISNIIAN